MSDHNVDLIHGGGEGRWKDWINPETGEHSVKNHELKVVQTWCEPDKHYYEHISPSSRQVICKHCKQETYYVLGPYQLIDGKIVAVK